MSLGAKTLLRVCCLLCVMSGAARADVADYLGKPVGSVRLEIEGRETTDPKLLEVVETRVGQPLSMVEVRESLAHLYSFGRFDDVQVHATLAADGVALRFELLPIHHVAKIELTGQLGAPGVDAGRIRRAVVDRFGASPPAARAADAARLIADLLKERGYLHAGVTPQTNVRHPAEQMTLAFSIEPGVRTRIGDVAIDGVAPPMIPSVIEQLGVRAGDPYQPDVLAARIVRYIADRRRAGYYEANVVPAVRLADSDRVANLRLTVTPGPRVRVVFAGDQLPADRRAELVPVVSEGSVDEDLLEDSSHRIEEYLRAQGYRDAAAPHERVTRDDELVITFTVKKGPQYRVTRYEISGNAQVPTADFAGGLRLREGQPFSETRLDADVATIEAHYSTRGFATAKTQSGVDPVPVPPGVMMVPVVVRIVIAEGARTLVGAPPRFLGNQSVPDATLREGLGLEPGRPFSLAQLAQDRDVIQLHYANLGYPAATVESNPGLSADRARADVVFTVREGPRIFVDHILIVGNVRTSTDTIERELQIKPGDPLGQAAVNESQRRLASLGLFRRTRISELRHGDETTRDLLVTVEEAPVTTADFGGGVEAALRPRRTVEEGVVDRLEVAPRAFFAVGRRNLFGKNRSVNLFTRVSLRQNDAPFPGAVGVTPAQGSGFGLNEYRLYGIYREPRAFDTPADAAMTGTYEQQIRSSFNFRRQAFDLDFSRRLSRDVSISGNYQIQRIVRFNERINTADQLDIDRLFPTIRLSSFSSSGVVDKRNDVLDPTSGRYFSGNAQLAARRIGSEVGFVKSFVTAQLFHRLPTAKAIVFAGNARLGMATGLDAEREVTLSERFFAGGDTTVRGFANDRLGVPGKTLDSDGFPRGGNALVIFNAELRARVRASVETVGFFDTGNVFARTSDIDLGQLRSAVGFGLRYKSPVGPIRFDLGFKVHREVIAGVREGLTAIHISLGQAF